LDSRGSTIDPRLSPVCGPTGSLTSTVHPEVNGRDGAQNHQPEEGPFALRASAGRQAWREWMPIRAAAPDPEVVHRNFRFGDSPLADRTRGTGRRACSVDDERGLDATGDRRHRGHTSGCCRCCRGRSGGHP